MIKTRSENNDFAVSFTNGRHHAIADVPEEKGGTDVGLGPHELMEASLATCLNMIVRMEARKRGIELEAVESGVTLDRSQEGRAIFRYGLKFSGCFAQEEEEELFQAAFNCPVSKTLLKKIELVYEPDRAAI